jgi:hypothetical protein
MPIRINLLAEDQAAEEMRRQDPVKRAIVLASFLVALVLMWSGWLQIKLGYAAHEQANYEGQWAKLEKDFATVTENLQKTAEIESKLSALHQLETNRFLPLMPARRSISSDLIRPSVLHSDRGGRVQIADGKRPGKPPTSIEKILLTITAMILAVHLIKSSIQRSQFAGQDH